VPAAVTRAADVQRLFEPADQLGAGKLELAIYNAGNNTPGNVLDMTAEYFENAWRVGCFGGFLFGREAAKRMVTQARGTLIFTGASASLRGKPNFAAFAAAKAGLRALAQSLARDLGPKGVHVSHVVIDGGIAGDKILTRFPQFAERAGEDGLLDLDAIAESYWQLHLQHRSAWTHELELRPFKETW
jgi:NAD(P)-dependent dehydrogenase (short-subunit alcohol dehydrogenase family)